MQIVVISYKFPSGAIKLIKMFCLKLFAIDINTVPETVVFSICDCILIKLVYSVLVKDVIISCLNVYTVGKRIFRSIALGLYKSMLKIFKRPSIVNNCYGKISDLNCKKFLLSMGFLIQRI